MSDHSTVVVSRKGDPSPAVAVTVVPRQLGHLRHHHKYTAWGVPDERGFWFRDGAGPANGTVAHNLEELRRILPTCSDDALRHHASGHDFSRWVDLVFADHDLAAEMGPWNQKCSEPQIRPSSGKPAVNSRTSSPSIFETQSPTTADAEHVQLWL